MKTFIISLFFTVFLFANANAKNEIKDVSLDLDKLTKTEQVESSLVKKNTDCIALAFAVDACVEGGISYEMFACIVDNCEAQKLH